MRRRIVAAGLIMIAIIVPACSGPPDIRTGRTPTTTAAPSASPAPSTDRTPGADTGTVTVVMNGDLLWHNTLWYGAHEDAVRKGHWGLTSTTSPRYWPA